jgi:hypothetical protein
MDRPLSRLAAHTGEHVEVEPLAKFLERERAVPSAPMSFARPTWRPSLSDYDLERLAPEGVES